ncbi:hypothetical protein AB2N04_07325 [Nitratireductor sp. GISD-1A_MAKvit]|uniref:hypothetical protein n=1 Tax=Nitratireductor sp. GISD-1A_MAKvit TaxID=3234198 RepID=UPI003464FE26
MKLLVPGALALLLVGTVGYFPNFQKAEDTVTPPEANQSEQDVSGAEFILTRIGSEHLCKVRHAPADERAELTLGPDCTLLVPDLAEARIWEERADGTVAFVSQSGETIMEFFAGDGLTYESLRPKTPILSMYRPD